MADEESVAGPMRLMEGLTEPLSDLAAEHEDGGLGVQGNEFSRLELGEDYFESAFTLWHVFSFSCCNEFFVALLFRSRRAAQSHVLIQGTKDHDRKHGVRRVSPSFCKTTLFSFDDFQPSSRMGEQKMADSVPELLPMGGAHHEDVGQDSLVERDPAAWRA